MTLPDLTPVAKRGPTCRATVWEDIVIFFLLNYVLHACTVLLEPRSGVLQTLYSMCAAIFMPYAGLARAFVAISKLLLPMADALDKVKHSLALCMVVEWQAGQHQPSYSNITPEYP